MTLLRPRWIAGHLVVLLLSATFVSLGLWQLARNHHKQELVRASRAAYAAPAPDVGTGAAPATRPRAQASGRYDVSHESFLTNRVHGGKAGVDVLTPLVLDDGDAVLVDRGWIEGTPLGQPSSSTAPAATGAVVVRGIVHTSSALSAQDAVARVDGRLALPRVDLARLGRGLPYRLRPVWIEAQSQTPAPGPDAPALPEPPPPDQVNHMQYAIEWFAFAAIGLIGWPIALVSISRRRGGFSTTAD